MEQYRAGYLAGRRCLCLIDYLLSGSGINTDYADVNEDSEINIADVTSLIDKLLAGN